MTMRTLITVCLLLLPLSAIQAQDKAAYNVFKDVPNSSWEYQALTDLEASGITLSLPSHQGKHRSLTRYEFAVIIDRTMRTFMDTKPPRSTVRLSTRAAQSLHRFFGEYQEEMSAIGVTTKLRMQMINFVKRYEPAGSPFVDVQKDHWGSESVERLRKMGIFVGYPDGLFHG